MVCFRLKLEKYSSIWRPFLVVIGERCFFRSGLMPQWLMDQLPPYIFEAGHGHCPITGYCFLAVEFLALLNVLATINIS